MTNTTKATKASQVSTCDHLRLLNRATMGDSIVWSCLDCDYSFIETPVDIETLDIVANHNGKAVVAASNKGNKVTAKADKGVQKLSTDQKAIPTDPAELRDLIKITRDRRWRAGRRGDEALVERMDARLVKLLKAQRKQNKANDSK